MAAFLAEPCDALERLISRRATARLVAAMKRKPSQPRLKALLGLAGIKHVLVHGVRPVPYTLTDGPVRQA